MFARRVQVLLVALLVVALPLLHAQTAPTLANIKKIYVAPMDNHLDQYITSEISKQFKGSREVVTDQSRADAILKGVNLGAQNTTQATVNLTDPAGKTVSLVRDCRRSPKQISRHYPRWPADRSRPPGQRPEKSHAIELILECGDSSPLLPT